jgi:NitT/TauT family transport system substrate-binding protein
MIARRISSAMSAVVCILALAFTAGCDRDTKSNMTSLDVLLDWKPQMEQAGFIVADAKGFYREQGLKISFHEGQGATTTAALVGSGRYDLGISSGGATIIARSKGVPVVSIALLNQRSPTVIFALKSSGIVSPSDLIGKRIGLTQTGVKFDEYRALMSKLGIDRSQITEVDVKKAVAPLLSGSLDAMLGYTEDQPVLVELQGKKVVRIPMSRYGVNVLSTNIVSNETYIKSNADICRKFVLATLKGWKRAIEHPEEAVMIYLDRYPESREDFVRENFRQFVPLLFSSDTDSSGLGTQTEQGFRETETLLHDLGIISTRVDARSALTNQFLPGIHASKPEPSPRLR